MLIAGRTSSFGAGASGDIYLLKFNSDGDTLWTKFYQDEGAEEPYSLLETMDGNYLIVGFSRENNSFLFLRYYLKVNINGEKMWDNKIVDTIKKFSFSTIELSNGDLISTGSVRFDSYEKGQVLVYKSDKFGNILWEKDFGEGDYSENGYAIKQSIDGSFTITGRSDQYVTKCDIVLLKIESNGNQIWYKRFGTQNLDRGKNVIIDSNDDIIITGEYNVDYFDLYEGDIFMTKIDKNGNFK